MREVIENGEIIHLSFFVFCQQLANGWVRWEVFVSIIRWWWCGEQKERDNIDFRGRGVGQGC